MSVLIAAAVIGVVGIFAGVLLGIASEKFKVKEDEKAIAIREVLPGNNCGGCGYPGCDGLATAISCGEANPDSCPVGGEEVAKKIAEIVGGEVSAVKMVAHVKCAGSCDKAKEAYEYVGPKNCKIAANAPGGGAKACAYGCLGYGSCVTACQFDAISIVDGIAVINKDKCKSCGMCVAQCSRNIIEMVPYDVTAIVECNSKDFGKDVKAVCQTGCIGCGICERNCLESAIKVENFLAKVDYSKCTGCGACKEKCPVKVIS